jgi:UDP-N-acetylglucosamine transferase subunit ALG13
MIFVTVGTHYQGFDRLIRKMDEIAGKIEEDVIMQIGSTQYKPINAKY